MYIIICNHSIYKESSEKCSQTSHQTLHKAWVDCIMKVKVVSVITFSVIGIELFTAALFVV